jgi:beta-mannosidase
LLPLERSRGGDAVERLVHDWQTCVVPPDGEPGGWLPAEVPGTVAAALRDAGRIEPIDLDAYDCWFRTTFECEPARAGEELVLALGGIATVAEVDLNGERILDSESMFLAHELDVGALVRDRNELQIRCRALAPLLERPRRPRARWRTRLAAGGLRFQRTMLLGRAPGFAAGPAAVGPWRPVELRRRHGVVVEELVLRPRLDGADGVLDVHVRLRALDGALPEGLDIEVGGRSSLVPVDGGLGIAEGSVTVPNVAVWWPCTHGEQVLHDVVLRIGDSVLAERRVGFRLLEPGAGYDVDEAPLALSVNGVEVFARGAVWTPPDFVRVASDRETLRRALQRMRAASLNMVRLPGTGAYESAEFHELCDELGLLVWQDFMFANFDYPIADPDFRALVEREARQELAVVAGRPSLAVLCGNSEVEQQVAMLGLERGLGRGELFGELLPGLAAEAGVDAVYVPSAPSGGDLPFRPDQGVANYYGVGGYRRPLDDARRARVGFAAECLAIANVPDDEALEEAGLLAAPVHDPRWKAGVPRDSGVGWDFDDVRDWYLEHLFAVDPNELRRVSAHRYLELSRAVSGEVMAEVFGEWRRGGSPSAGGLVLWLHDLAAGAGWGLVDSAGRPKVAYHHLRRMLAPVACWTTDEGLGGIDVHIANDAGKPLHATLRVALYRDLEQRVEQAAAPIEVSPHSAVTHGVEAVLGRFVDVAYAYRFGPPGHDLVVASLEADDGRLLSQAFRFPAGRPLGVESAERLGLVASAESVSDGQVRLRVSSRRFAYGVRVTAPGWAPDDDAFGIEPGGTREVLLQSATAGAPFAAALTALNLDGRVIIAEPA